MNNFIEKYTLSSKWKPYTLILTMDFTDDPSLISMTKGSATQEEVSLEETSRPRASFVPLAQPIFHRISLQVSQVSVPAAGIRKTIQENAAKG